MPADLIQLHEPVVADAIRTVNFFNGRLLTGNDLGREQQARRDGLGRLGQALGDGIAAGLEAEFAGNIAPGRRPAMTISPGLAINRAGAVLGLAEPATVALDRTAASADTAVACLFDDCMPAAPGAYIAGEGLNLLVISPSFVSEGRAQVSGMGGAGARCAFDATAEAVQFRLLPVRPEIHRQDPAAADFRNRLAYRCFGGGVLRAWSTDLAAAGSRGDDLLEEMRGEGLTDSDVPLALIHFTGAATEGFTDLWSVRRPLCRRDAGDAFAMIADPRRVAVGQAMYRQFHGEILELAATPGALAATRAADRFAYLPPAGFLPLLDDAHAAAFFSGLTVSGPHFIDAASVEPLLRESFSMPAIPTTAGEPGANHAIWLYRVASVPAGRMPNLLFASGHLPYRGDARFNLNHWDQANYALIP
ncbi:MAG: hypothetical protein RQ966_06300 [Acetobacteraceae bacterium]|nr:hypothetical protein [Acetobacteraceae bacterium]